MSDIEIWCTCGNPLCKGHVQFRKGYVNIRHKNGTEEVRWDHFYIDAFDINEANETAWVELMVEPVYARKLMWFLILGYMPVVSHVFEWIGQRFRWVHSLVWEHFALNDVNYPEEKK